MARVTVDTVDHVARLAQLSLTDEERTLFARQLEDILTWADELRELDTGDVAPMDHAAAAEAWREDEARPGLPTGSAVAGAPDAEAGFFRVPPVIGG